MPSPVTRSDLIKEINACIQEKRRFPKLVYLADRLGCSITTVHTRLWRLHRDCVIDIRRVPGGFIVTLPDGQHTASPC